MSPFLVYLAMQADDVKGCLEVVLAICVVFAVLVIIQLMMSVTDEERERPCKWFKGLLAGILFTIACSGLLPSTKTIAAMVIIPAVTQSENFKALPEDVLAFLRSIIKEHSARAEQLKPSPSLSKSTVPTAPTL